MVTLTEEQADVLFAFCEAFDLYTTDAWQSVENGMRDDFGIAEPEDALEDAKRALNPQYG